MHGNAECYIQQAPNVIFSFKNCIYINHKFALSLKVVKPQDCVEPQSQVMLLQVKLSRNAMLLSHELTLSRNLGTSAWNLPCWHGCDTYGTQNRPRQHDKLLG